MAASSERAQRRSERGEELQALARLMADPAGRRWVRELLVACHVWTTSFGTNALAMAFREGERSVGIRLLTDIEAANRDAFLEMLKENIGERPSSDRRGNGTDPDAGAGDFA